MKKESHKKIYISPQASVIVMHNETLLAASELEVKEKELNSTTTYEVGW